MMILMLWLGSINGLLGLLLISGTPGIFRRRWHNTGTALSLPRGFFFCLHLYGFFSIFWSGWGVFFFVSSSISGTCQVGHFDSHTFFHLDRIFHRTFVAGCLTLQFDNHCRFIIWIRKFQEIRLAFCFSIIP